MLCQAADKVLPVRWVLYLRANAREVVSNGITLPWQVREGVCRELKERSLLDVDEMLLDSSIAESDVVV